MKCPECVKNGEHSRVYIGMRVTTCMGVSHFYDEDGRIHIHDPNSTYTQYSCSNGHSWGETTRSKCGVCGE